MHTRFDYTSDNTLNVTLADSNSSESSATVLTAFDASSDEAQPKLVAVTCGESSKLLYGDAESGGAVYSCDASVFDAAYGTTYNELARDFEHSETCDYRRVVFIACESAVLVIEQR